MHDSVSMDVSDNDGDCSEEEVLSDSLYSEIVNDSAKKSNSASDGDADVVGTPVPQDPDDDVKHASVRLTYHDS